MNVITTGGWGEEQARSLTLHNKQRTIVLEEKGVAIRIRFDRKTRKFAVEDLTAEHAKTLVAAVRKGLEVSS